MDGLQAIDVTPTKFLRLWRKWFKKENEIKWKGFRSATKFSGVLDIPPASVNVESYICSDHVFAVWSGSRNSKKPRKLFFARWRKILWGIIEWSVVCLRTRQLLQVLQHQQNLFTTEKIESYPDQIPKMSYFGRQKRGGLRGRSAGFFPEQRLVIEPKVFTAPAIGMPGLQGQCQELRSYHV